MSVRNRSARATFVAAGIALSCFGHAHAQQQGPYLTTPPQYYSYEFNPFPNDSTNDPLDLIPDYAHDPRFAAAVKFEMRPPSNPGYPNTPAEAAAKAIEQIQERLLGIGSDEQTLDPEKICIMLQNFGGFDALAYQDTDFSFKRAGGITFARTALTCHRGSRLGGFLGAVT